MFTRRLPPAAIFSAPRSLLLPSVRAIHPSISPPEVPEPTVQIPDVPTFLKKIGRNTTQHEPKFESWPQFFSLTSKQMKALGVEPARDRRYIIHWREAFRASNGTVVLKERKRGKKIDGGERRQKEVRAKRRAAQNKDKRQEAENEKLEKEMAFV